MPHPTGLSRVRRQFQRETCLAANGPIAAANAADEAA